MKTFLLFIVVICAVNAHSQSPKECVVEFFEVFNKRDVEKLESFFTSQATMFSVLKNKNDSTIVLYEKVEDFLKVFAENTNIWREEISNIKVEQDGDFAQAWFDYEFYFNGKLNHCGVDAFQMVRVNSEWKLIHLADTRRKNCKQ